jgi:hypothetical protein
VDDGAAGDVASVVVAAAVVVAVDGGGDGAAVVVVVVVLVVGALEEAADVLESEPPLQAARASASTTNIHLRSPLLVTIGQGATRPIPRQPAPRAELASWSGPRRPQHVQGESARGPA